MRDRRICVILPALNEEEGVKKVLELMPNPVVDKVVLLDGNSVDNTVEAARSVREKYFRLEVMKQEGRGKGMAFQSFLRKFDLDSHDIYVMLDADCTYDPEELEKMVAPLFDGADVVMGDRFSLNHMKESMPFTTYMGNKLFTFLARSFYSKNTNDVCTGYWAFSKEFLKAAKINAKGFDLEVNLFSEAAKKKFRIESVPIRYGKRIGDKKLKMRHGFTILWRLLRERLS
jgi:dolichol-phosphate mannosyltransferase